MGASLPTEGLDRAEADRAPKRVSGPDQRNAEREREAPGEDAAGEVGLDEPGRARPVAEHVCREHAETKADRQREQRDAERLADDQGRDPPGTPADRAQDANLTHT